MFELKNHLSSLKTDELILDVRGPDEFREGHVPGATNIPHTEVAKHIDQLKKFKTIYIHCRMGGRASMAAQILQGAGLTSLVCVSDGGMPDWEAAGFPVER